jgi:(E)-4-hydroxy-3-methylbut-2-enyl-diphosphate synthase
MGEKITGYRSSVITIGDLLLGGSYPVRLQSMTNTDTLDTDASVAQCIRIIEAGADLVRLTAQGVREAQNLAIIKNELRKAGFVVPVIADIHFNPAAAETAARLVEKVRINPGNYTDKRASFQSVDLTEMEYAGELERIHERLLPLISICREHGTAIRIGINHGSLSDRIMTRYGNTPEGMVQSALEFIDIFRSENFGKLVLSMKSSDTLVMVRSTRMLAEEMQKRGLSYPLHLGVTEAGEGEDGRVRSAAGIGALLRDGIGDTIRVSLSEDPEKEIPVARKIAEIYPRDPSVSTPAGPVHYTTPRARPDIFRKINGPIVVADFMSLDAPDEESWIMAGFRKDQEGNIVSADGSADLVLANRIPGNVPLAVNLAVPHTVWINNRHIPNIFPVFTAGEFIESSYWSDWLNIIFAYPDTSPALLKQISPENSIILYSFDVSGSDSGREVDQLFSSHEGTAHNIVLNPVFFEDDKENFVIKAAAVTGGWIIDNMAAGLCLKNFTGNDPAADVSTAFSILQCTGKRITRTVYLSCPTCGRTKFNLQETIRKVKAATGHLKGLKIAVMGCIVNGPGEMAGADYGYVGAAPGKVHIYRGMNTVMKNVPEEQAIEELLRVIGEDR